MSRTNREDLGLEELKESIFDPVLAYTISVRVIHGAHITEYFRYRPIVERLTPIIKRIINPPLLETIQNKTENEPFDVYSLKRRIYVPEDRARSCLTKLVQFVHGYQDKTLVRNLTQSCMNLLLREIHSKEFGIEFSDALSSLNIYNSPNGNAPKKKK